MDVVRRVFVNGTDVDLLVIIIQGLLPLIFGLVKELLCPLPRCQPCISLPPWEVWFSSGLVRSSSLCTDVERSDFLLRLVQGINVKVGMVLLGVSPGIPYSKG